MNGQAKLYTPKQTARFFGVSVRTLYEWRKKGIIKAVKIDRLIRFHPDEIKQVVKKNTIHQGNSRRKYF